jgi:drug/metabolite transporter (DMT)-like permease
MTAIRIRRPSVAGVRPAVPMTVAWGLGLALCTALISGVSVWVNSYGVKTVPDAALYTTLKNGVAAAILLGALAFLRPADRRRLTPAEWRRLLVIGVVGGSIPFVLFFTGLAQATAPGAAFIHKTMFIWVALLAVPFLGERLGLLQVLALVALLGGQLLLAPPNLAGAGWGTGETLIALATLLWAVETVIARRLLGSVPSLVVGAGRMGIGLVLLVGYLVVTGKLGGIVSVSAEGWGWVLLTGILLAGYVSTWMAALQRAPASAVTAVLVLAAVITTILQALANGTSPAPTSVIGALVLAAGVATVGIISARAPEVAVGRGPARADA